MSLWRCVITRQVKKKNVKDLKEKVEEAVRQFLHSNVPLTVTDTQTPSLVLLHP